MNKSARARTVLPLPSDLTTPSRRVASIQRQLGAYYTGPDAALVMADWVLERGARRVLEPSFGAGAFIDALTTAAQRRLRSVEIFGAELDAEAFQSALNSELVDPRRVHLGDFLDWSAPQVDAVIGNPPYVRLRHLPQDQAARALKVAEQALGVPMETSGSVWMPFVFHAASSLRTGGRMALVLPFDFTYVRYARPLWRWLAQAFGSLRLVRVHERLFPDILQDVVILFADDRGGCTRTIAFEAFDRVTEFLAGKASRSAEVEIAAVIAGERAFMRALLPSALREELEGRLLRLTEPVRELCTFNIGYVCGDKDFFHPTTATQRRFDLPSESLRLSLTSSRQLRGVGIHTSAVQADSADFLFMPAQAPERVSTSERKYIELGESLDVHLRYKCRVREPWYVVPGVRTPDLILSVFSERPLLVINDGKYVATNSLLCGFLKRGTPEGFLAGWYTSLTLLGCESEVHALGGGVMVLVPKEAGNIRIPLTEAPRRHLEQLDSALSRGNVQAAFEFGDEAILKGALRLPQTTIDLIRRGVEILAHWRTSARGGSPTSLGAAAENDGCLD